MERNTTQQLSLATTLLSQTTVRLTFFLRSAFCTRSTMTTIANHIGITSQYLSCIFSKTSSLGREPPSWQPCCVSPNFAKLKLRDPEKNNKNATYSTWVVVECTNNSYKKLMTTSNCLEVILRQNEQSQKLLTASNCLEVIQRPKWAVTETYSTSFLVRKPLRICSASELSVAFPSENVF